MAAHQFGVKRTERSPRAQSQRTELAVMLAFLYLADNLIGNALHAFVYCFIDVGRDFFKTGQHGAVNRILRLVISGRHPVKGYLRTQIGSHGYN